MTDQRQPEFVLSDDHNWSFRMARIPFTGHDNRQSLHWFLVLVEEGSTSSIINEMHFTPVDHRGMPFRENGLAVAQENEEPRRPGVPLLGALAYKSPRRQPLETLFTITVDNGSTDRMLHVWNNALAAAVDLRNLGYPWGSGIHCKTGMEATLQNLGYDLEAFASSEFQREPEVGLAAVIARRSPEPVPDRPALLKRFSDLRTNLKTPRQPAATARRDFG